MKVEGLMRGAPYWWKRCDECLRTIIIFLEKADDYIKVIDLRDFSVVNIHIITCQKSIESLTFCSKDDAISFIEDRLSIFYEIESEKRDEFEQAEERRKKYLNTSVNLRGYGMEVIDEEATAKLLEREIVQNSKSLVLNYR